MVHMGHQRIAFVFNEAVKCTPEMQISAWMKIQIIKIALFETNKSKMEELGKDDC